MSVLRATLIDVGWGDSILVEIENAGNVRYGLIDSNDTATLRSGYIFLKRFFEKKSIQVPTSVPIFDWVLLSHAHADHGQGLRRILKDFGTSRFWYPEPSVSPAFFASLLRFARLSPRVVQHDVIHSDRVLPNFGGATMAVLWPTPSLRPPNENNNSVVLTISTGNASFVFTGDAEADSVWSNISSLIPSNTVFFKVPHHGSSNGTFTSARSAPWLSYLPANACVAISSHVRPFSHPDADVIEELAARVPIYRTDQHYHVTVETDGNKFDVKYSHI